MEEVKNNILNPSISLLYPFSAFSCEYPIISRNPAFASNLKFLSENCFAFYRTAQKSIENFYISFLYAYLENLLLQKKKIFADFIEKYFSNISHNRLKKTTYYKSFVNAGKGLEEICSIINSENRENALRKLYENFNTNPKFLAVFFNFQHFNRI